MNGHDLERVLRRVGVRDELADGEERRRRLFGRGRRRRSGRRRGRRGRGERRRFLVGGGGRGRFRRRLREAPRLRRAVRLRRRRRPSNASSINACDTVSPSA